LVLLVALAVRDDGWTGDREIDAKNETLAAFYPTSDLRDRAGHIFFWWRG